MQNTAGKKRARQMDADSDFPFGDCLQRPAFRSTDNKANLNRQIGLIRERLKTLGEQVEGGRRDGGLKMDWTKPLPRVAYHGVGGQH
jgi:hypothetical protein